MSNMIRNPKTFSEVKNTLSNDANVYLTNRDFCRARNLPSDWNDLLKSTEDEKPYWRAKRKEQRLFKKNEQDNLIKNSEDELSSLCWDIYNEQFDKEEREREAQKQKSYLLEFIGEEKASNEPKKIYHYYPEDYENIRVGVISISNEQIIDWINNNSFAEIENIIGEDCISAN